MHKRIDQLSLLRENAFSINAKSWAEVAVYFSFIELCNVSISQPYPIEHFNSNIFISTDSLFDQSSGGLYGSTWQNTCYRERQL
jgi:hypothetical protein